MATMPYIRPPTMDIKVTVKKIATISLIQKIIYLFISQRYKLFLNKVNRRAFRLGNLLMTDWG